MRVSLYNKHGARNLTHLGVTMAQNLVYFVLTKKLLNLNKTTPRAKTISYDHQAEVGIYDVIMSECITKFCTFYL